MKTKTLKKICITAAFAAVTGVLSPFTVPTPVGVPITLQTLAIALTAFLLGAEAGTAAICIYVLLGVAGLPVFSNFTGGAAALTTPSGGFIIAFPLFALVLSFAFYVNKILPRILIIAAALLVLYAFGTVQFIIITGTGAPAAVSAFSLYFIKDVAVVFAAYLLCLRIRPAISRFIGP